MFRAGSRNPSRQNLPAFGYEPSQKIGTLIVGYEVLGAEPANLASEKRAAAPSAAVSSAVASVTSVTSRMVISAGFARRSFAILTSARVSRRPWSAATLTIHVSIFVGHFLCILLILCVLKDKPTNKDFIRQNGMSSSNSLVGS